MTGTMRIIIQCAGSKCPDAGRLTGPSGEKVLFVARPDKAPSGLVTGVRYCRPDDLVGPGKKTWRDHLVAYNRSKSNPDCLFSAADLYRPSVYRELVAAFGGRNVYVLSAGWGLIRSAFLTPEYDVTFSPQGSPWSRRPTKQSPAWFDLNHLAEDLGTRSEPIHYFGGRGYLPLLARLAEGLSADVLVHHINAAPVYPSFRYSRFESDRSQNWHYDAVKAFIKSS
jgi:hypothetical protein